MAKKWIARQSSQSIWSISEGDAVMSSRTIAMSISRKTDAHLIAASPKMLEALETLTAVIGLTPIVANKAAVQEAFNQARAAIAAAKGE